MTDMLVNFRCSHCGAQLAAGVKLVGTKGTCPNCGIEVTVPEKDAKTQNNKEQAVREK